MKLRAGWSGHFLIVLFLALLHNSAYAFAPVHITERPFSNLKIESGIEYLRDEGGELTLQQARSLKKWQAIESDAPAFGFDSASYWLRFSIVNYTRLPLDGLLEIAFPQLDDVRVFRFVQSPSAQKKQLTEFIMGDLLPFDSRPIAHSNFVVPLPMEPNSRAMIYIRIASQCNLQVPLIVWSKQSFYEHRQRHLMGQGLYFGVLLVMVLYNLFIYISVRHPSYLYYVGSVIGVGAFMGSYNGFGFQYVWSSTPALNQWALMISLGIYGVFSCAFTASLLHLSRNNSRLLKLIQGCAVLYGGVFFSVFVLSYYQSIILASIVGFATSIVSILAGAITLKNGLREARYHVLANGAMFIAGVVVVAEKMGILPLNAITQNALPAGYMVLVVLYSFALADRINQERRQKSEAQKKALENESLARDEHERYLEMQYNAKVAELNSNQRIFEEEAESRAKSEFLATMSHEIRTPMNGVLGMAELLKDTELDPQQQQYLSVIDNTGKSLLNIINDILDYSKIAAGKLELETIEIDLVGLCEDIAKVFQATAARKQLEFIIFIEPGLPHGIQGDPTRFRQVLFNLLNNAFKFTEHGSVIMRVSQQPDQASPQKCQLLFEVQDTGIGIAPDKQQTLFQPFMQVDTSLTREFGGTGLGLTISHNLAAMMDGNLLVSSTPGEGSVFQFSVKCPILQAARAMARVRGMQTLAKKNVLVVDSSLEYLDAVAKVLRFHGMQVVTASSAAEAYQWINNAANRPLDLIIVNDELADQKGSDWCAQLQLDTALANVPRILTTAPDGPHCDIDMQGAGINRAIPRPIVVSRIVDPVLDVVLRRTQAPLDQRVTLANRFSGKRVLVAEDNPVNQAVVSKMLEKMGLTFDLVCHGREALDCLLRDYQAYDLVLMDCEMPVMNGFDATQALRQQESKLHQARKPVIALTAHVLGELKQKAGLAGMDEVLSKPLEYSVLESTLARYLPYSQLRGGWSANVD